MDTQGNVVVVVDRGRLVKYDRNGEVIWNLDLGARSANTVVALNGAANSGTVLAGNHGDDAFLQTLQADGSVDVTVSVSSSAFL